MVFSLVYVGAVAPGLGRDELWELLEQCRRTNVDRGITGLLLYRDGRFLQLLEGERAQVESVFRAVQDDERYSDLVVVRRREQPARQFPSWTMAFGDVDPTSLAPVAVESPPPAGPAPQTEAEAAFILELLELFDP